MDHFFRLANQLAYLSQLYRVVCCFVKRIILTSTHKEGVQGAKPLAEGAEGTLPGGQVIPRIFLLPLFASEGSKL